MTDLPRWTTHVRDPESPWLPRVRLLAERVWPGAVVIDVGAGTQALRRLLDPTCLYIPVDCVPGAVVRYDFNGVALAPDLAADVAVVSGMFEYVNDPMRALTTIHRWAPRILMSYATYDGGGLEGRVASGFLNHLTIDDLAALVNRLGMSCEPVGEWQGQALLDLRRMPAKAWATVSDDRVRHG